MSTTNETRDFLEQFVAVRFIRGGGTHSRKDPELSRETNERYGMIEGQGTVELLKWAKGETKDIDSYSRSIRAAFKSMTVGWLDAGTGLIPVAGFQKLDDKLMRMSRTLMEMIDTRNYEGMLLRAEAALSGRFRREDYPDSIAEFRLLYEVRWFTVPHPNRKALAEGVAVTVERDIAARVTERSRDLEEGMSIIKADIAEKILTPLRAMAEKCEKLNEGNAEKMRIYASLTENITKVARTVRELIPGDTALGQQIKTILDLLNPLATIDTTLLKDNDEYRAQVAKTAATAIDLVARTLAA